VSFGHFNKSQRKSTGDVAEKIVPSRFRQLRKQKKK